MFKIYDKDFKNELYVQTLDWSIDHINALDIRDVEKDKILNDLKIRLALILAGDDYVFSIRKALLEEMQSYAQLSVYFSIENAAKRYPGIEKYFTFDNHVRLQDLRKFDESIDNFLKYLESNDEVQKMSLTPEQISQIACEIMVNEAQKSMVYMKCFDFMKYATEDYVKNEAGEFNEKEDWFDPALLSFCLFFEILYKNMLSVPSVFEKVVCQEMLLAWKELYDFPDVNLLDIWDRKWKQVTGLDSLFK